MKHRDSAEHHCALLLSLLVSALVLTGCSDEPNEPGPQDAASEPADGKPPTWGDSGASAQPDGGSAAGDSGAADLTLDGADGGPIPDAAGPQATSDAGADAGDAASCQEEPCARRCVDPLALPMLQTAPATLAETGLYVDGAIAPYAEPFTPRYPLWSDGSEKLRWAYIPACSQIDTTAMNDWQAPPGTRVWKEFSLDGKKLETRLIHRHGSGRGDWLYATYLWNDDGTAATLVGDAGLADVKGTNHDIPSSKHCLDCHQVLPQRLLGLSAIQLTHDEPGLNMATLSETGRLSTPAPAGFEIPGDPATAEALGYLHGNCGNCHNSWASGVLDMLLRVRVEQQVLPETDAYRTTVGVPTAQLECDDCLRVTPGDPASSALILRMQTREPKRLMPPIGSEVVHTDGVRAVSEWINALEAAP